MRLALAAYQDRGDRHAQFVEQVLLDEQAQQRRAALGEHPPQSALVEDVECGARVDTVGLRSRCVDHLGHRTEPVARFRCGFAARQNQRRNLGAGEQLGVVLEVGGVGDDRDRGHLGLPAALTVLALGQRHLGAGIVLDPHRRGPDENDVGLLAHA